MKVMHLVVVAATTLTAALAVGTMAWASPPSRGPVVVELFQSQGCSDCPPAQLHLNALADRADVLALSFGVTYWDYLGWKDSFASPQFTQRQRDYSDRNNGAGVATPQYWINGRQTVLGADIARVTRLIAQGGPAGGPTVTVSGSSLNLGAGTAPSGGAEVLLVRYDPRVVQVAIRAGENGGRTIPHRCNSRLRTIFDNAVIWNVRGRTIRASILWGPSPPQNGAQEKVIEPDGCLRYESC